MTTYYNRHELIDFLVSIGGDDEFSMANEVLTRCLKDKVTRNGTDYISHTSLTKVLHPYTMQSINAAGITSFQA